MVSAELRALTGQFTGLVIIQLRTVTSTNDVALQLARRGAGDLTLIIADEQTAGRGRRGRSWVAPPGKALLCSFILRPSLAPARSQRLTMLAGVAAVRAIGGLGLPARLKWPNDIMINGRKVGGILTETEIAGQSLRHAVVGIGINVNVPAGNLLAISDQATSLSVEAGHRFSRWRLLRLLLAELTLRYGALAQDEGQAVHAEWTALLETLGREVTVRAGDAVLAGRAEAVDEDGSLLLRLDDGHLERVTLGDVS